MKKQFSILVLFSFFAIQAIAQSPVKAYTLAAYEHKYKGDAYQFNINGSNDSLEELEIWYFDSLEYIISDVQKLLSRSKQLKFINFWKFKSKKAHKLLWQIVAALPASVTSFKCTNSNMRSLNIDVLKKKPHIVDFDLSENGIKDLDRILTQVKQLQSVCILKLDNNPIHKLPLDSLLYDTLYILSLQETNIRTIPFKTIVSAKIAEIYITNKKDVSNIRFIGFDSLYLRNYIRYEYCPYLVVYWGKFDESKFNKKFRKTYQQAGIIQRMSAGQNIVTYRGMCDFRRGERYIW